MKYAPEKHLTHTHPTVTSHQIKCMEFNSNTDPQKYYMQFKIGNTYIQRTNRLYFFIAAQIAQLMLFKCTGQLRQP